jgi:hypothetical protein
MNESTGKAKMNIVYNRMPIMCPVTIPTKNMNIFSAVILWVITTRKWKIEESWFYTIDEIDYVIEKGFIFDGASVPKLFRSWLSPMGILLIPGLVHDYGYKNSKIRLSNGEYAETKDREYFDTIFRETAISVNGFKVLNYIAYYALRLFGWIPWKSHRKND